MRPHLATLVDEFRGHAAETAVVEHRGVRRFATTYGELATLAGRFAAELERRGVAPGARVALWGKDSAEWIGVFFGCLLRGVVAVPLDAAGEAAFAARVIGDVGATLVVADAELLAALALFDARSTLPKEGAAANGERGTENVERIPLRGIRPHLPSQPLWDVAAAVGPDTPFQIVFTSGTTREPRGVVHTHRNVLATLEPIEREIAKYRKWERLFHPLRFLHSLPLSHVFGQFMGLWCPALLAAEVHFAEGLEPGRMVELIRQQRISVLVAVPRVLEMLRGYLLEKFADSSRFSVVSSQKKPASAARRTENSPRTTVLKKWWRWRKLHRALGWKFWAVISGGATLPPELETFWNAAGFALIQGYGMTETTALVTLNHPFHIKQGTIGSALPGREVKLGQDGEILVRGDVVAAAVWERGAIRPRPGEWLATGDLAERSAGGELRFVGRKADVIVTRAGMNVHPGDLEEALAAQPQVRGVVVVGCDFSAGPEAVAVVLFAGTGEQLARAIERANAGLAEYQRIRRWARWPELEFPHTSTGKLLRREVKQWVCAGGAGATGPAIPRAARVDLDAPDGVAGVLRQLAGQPAEGGDRLRLDEDWKLDSLARVELQSALEEKFGVELEDDRMAAIATVGELRTMLEANLVPSPLSVDPAQPETQPLTGSPATGNPEPAARMVYPRWAWWGWVRWVRIVWIECALRPLVWLLARPRVVDAPASALEPQTANREPVLIVCNHVTAFDAALVLYALPGRLRRRVACAMSGEMLMDFRRARGQANWLLNALAPAAWLLLTALFNVFPLPRAKGFRRSFRHAGDALDQGYSVLVFPEGARSRDGRMHPFRPGIGLLAEETQAAVLPVGLRGLYDYPSQPGSPPTSRELATANAPRRRWLHAGTIEVRIGAPMRVEGHAQQATARLAAAVRQLAYAFPDN
jgi:long-chain acyl-CoA synthetase